MCAVHGLQPRLRAGVGQSFQNDGGSGVQWAKSVVVGGWRPGFLLRDRWGDQRRDLPGLPSAHRNHPYAAQGNLWIHPKQGDLSHPGTDSGCRQGVSREKIAPGCNGRGFLEYDQARRNGPRSEALAGPGGDESRTACDGRRDAVERVAALFAWNAVTTCCGARAG
jgi:hypothetical protein